MPLEDNHMMTATRVKLPAYVPREDCWQRILNHPTELDLFVFSSDGSCPTVMITQTGRDFIYFLKRACKGQNVDTLFARTRYINKLKEECRGAVITAKDLAGAPPMSTIEEFIADSAFEEDLGNWCIHNRDLPSMFMDRVTIDCLQDLTDAMHDDTVYDDIIESLHCCGSSGSYLSATGRQAFQNWIQNRRNFVADCKKHKR
jgi:hypothetical protein